MAISQGSFRDDGSGSYLFLLTGDDVRGAAVVSSDRLQCRMLTGLGCDGPSGRTRLGQEAPRLPGTRLAWTPLSKRNFCPAQEHKEYSSWVVGLGGIFVHEENCILTNFRIILSSLSGNFSILRIFYCIIYFLVSGLLYSCCPPCGINSF